MFVFASSRSLFAESQTPWNKFNYKHFQKDKVFELVSKFTFTASIMFLVATTDTPLSATPWEGEGGHFVHFLPFFVVKKMFHLLYVSKHHLLTGRLNLLDQTDQKTSSTLRPPVYHVMSLIPCHRTMTSGKNMHMFLSKSLYVVFATGLLH